MNDTLHHQENHHLSAVVKRNIRTLLEVRRQMERKKNMQDRFADDMTAFFGSMRFVYAHVAWFGVWIVWNFGLLGLPVFDPYPFGLLTMMVSLEAIFLSTFVLISQNRIAAMADQRADLDLHVNLLAEYEVTKILKILDKMAKHQNIDIHDPEVKALEREVRPEELLQELEKEHEEMSH